MNKLWGVWELEDKIGQGSFGEVYKAHKKELNKDFYAAIKHISLPKNQDDIEEVIKEGNATNSDAVLEYYKDTIDDLVKEIEIMYELRANKNIVDYQDHLIIEKTDGEVGFDIYIRMELLKSLDSHLKNKQPTEEEVIKIGLDIATALAVCNKHDLLHRDIKPANIFIDEKGTFKLGDFGVARKLEKTTLGMSKKGTYNYMSPEIYKGLNADIRSDIYSLGIVMYRLLNNNKAPFIDKNTASVKASDNEEALMRRMNGEELPDIEGVSPAFMAIIKKASAFSKGDRYSKPEDLKEDLEKLEKGEIDELEKTVSIHGKEDPLDKTVSIYSEDELEKTVSIYSKEDELDKTVSIYSKGSGNQNYTSDEELRARIRKIMDEEANKGEKPPEYISMKVYKEKSKKLLVIASFALCVILAILSLGVVFDYGAQAFINDKLFYEVSYFKSDIVVFIITDVIVFICYWITLAGKRAQNIVSYGYLINTFLLSYIVFDVYSKNFRVSWFFLVMIAINILLYFNKYRWKSHLENMDVEKSEKEAYESRNKRIEKAYDKNNKKGKILNLVFGIFGVVALAVAIVFNLFPVKEQTNKINSSVKQIRIVKEYINIRENCTTTSNPVGRVYKDEVYTVLGEIDKKDGYGETVIWYNIRTSFGVEGCIASYPKENWVNVISGGD